MMAGKIRGSSARAKAAYRREYMREWRRRTGRVDGSGHHDATGVSGDIPGLENLFQALNEVGSGVAVRVRRKALQAIANELTKAAKKAVPKFDLKPSARATLRRAIYRRDPKVIQRYDRKSKRWRKSRPMSYRVSVRVGKSERAGADLGVYTSGKKKGQSRGVRQHNRDAFWWHWFERGTKARVTKRGLRRGRIKAQNVFYWAFDESRNAAIAHGERVGFAELKKILAKLEAKNKAQARKLDKP